MTWPVPRPGLVIRYSYLWEREARAGQEEGVKDRPCAIIVVLLRDGEHPVVFDEADDFIWPRPDLRPALSGDPSTIACPS